MNREARFNRLYAEHFEAVRRYAWRREPSLADDVVSETFLTAWRRLEDVPPSPRPWLIGIARNVRLNLRRGFRRQQALAGRVVDQQAVAATHDPQDDGAAVRAALAALPERDREVLMLAVWDDLDREGISAVLGCSRANVSLRLHRARRHLADALKGRSAGPDQRLTSPYLTGGSDVSY